METFRKSLAFLSAILFIISGSLALFAFNLERQAFNAAGYKRAFARQALYERIPAFMADALYNSAAADANADPFLQALTFEDWQQTITLLLPPQDLKAITDHALDSLFDYLNGTTDIAVLTLTPLKSNLTGPAGMQAARQVLSTQPACTAEQLLQMGLGFLSGDIALCNPPPEMLELMTPILETQLQGLSAAIPDEIPLISAAQFNPAEDPRQRLDLIRTLMKVTPVFPLLFLFALTVLAVRSLMDWLKWWGYPFLVTGGVSLLLTLTGAPILGYAVRQILQIQSGGLLPPMLLSLLGETVSSVTGEILRPVALLSGGLALGGFGMAVAAWIAAYRNRQRAR